MKKLLIVLLIVCLGMFAFFGNRPLMVMVKADSDISNAKGFILMSENGQILKKQNDTLRLPVASMIKTMTLLLTFDEIDKGTIKFDEVVLASETASKMGGSQVFIETNGEYTIETLIKSVIVASGNDAAVLLAEKISGSEAEFVVKMNLKAKELKLTNTNFTNATGLPSANNYSCALDMATIMKQLIKQPKYFEFSKIWMDKIPHPNGRFTEISNTNKLLKQYNLCDAGKTGSTNESGFCISATAQQNGLRLISVVVGSKTSKERFDLAKNLFNFGFANYENKDIILNNQKFDIKIEKSRDKIISAVVSEKFSTVIKKGTKNEIELKTILTKTLAPIKKGETIGEIQIVSNGEVIKKIQLLSEIDAKKIGYVESVKEIVEKFV